MCEIECIRVRDFRHSVAHYSVGWFVYLPTCTEITRFILSACVTVLLCLSVELLALGNLPSDGDDPDRRYADDVRYISQLYTFLELRPNSTVDRE